MPTPAFAVSPELQTQIASWRSKAVEGTLTLADMREAIKALRANRLSAAQASAKALGAKKPKKVVREAGAMLDELEGL